MATRYVIANRGGKETRLRISDSLAKSAAYMNKHQLKLAPEVPSIPLKTESKEETNNKTDAWPKTDAQPNASTLTDIKEDTVSMSVDDLKDKYVKDDWVHLAKSLGMKGNHSNTGEEKLITKIKNKLEE